MYAVLLCFGMWNDTLEIIIWLIERQPRIIPNGHGFMGGGVIMIKKISIFRVDILYNSYSREMVNESG